MILNTPHEQIDHVLGIFKSHGSFLTMDELKKKVDESPIVVEPSILDGIVEKLNRDNHIYKAGWTAAFQTTFEGNLFIGYDKQRQLDDERLTSIGQMASATKKYNTRLLWATWCAGIAAFLLLLWQIFVWINPVYASFPYILFGAIRK
jgi:hypothetical protein